MKRYLLALMFASGITTTFPGVTFADPDVPEPPQVGDLPRPPDPPGPAPRPPAPGKLPDVKHDLPWWDPFDWFDHDDKEEHRRRGHDKHEGKKDKHRNKHDD